MHQPRYMKRYSLILMILVGTFSIAAAIPDYFFVPESFFLKKGDKLDLHLLAGEAFVKQDEFKFEPSKTATFMLYEGSKKTDVSKIAKDTAHDVLNYPMNNGGLAMLEMTRKAELTDESQDNYADLLTAQGMDKLADKVKNGSELRIRERNTRYLKTLVCVGEPSGSVYEKVLNEEFEIVLKRNPYKRSYGEDMTAQLNFKGKPVKGASMKLYIKSASGNVYPQLFLTDEKGQITFTTSREGVYLLTSVRIEPVKDNDVDYQSWWTSFTFAFSNSGEMPASYREFGFGDKH